MILKNYSLLSVALALALAACAGDPPPVALAPPAIKRTLLRDIVPQSALTCAGEPASADVRTIAAAAGYVQDLRDAGRDCRRKLGAARALILNEAD